MKAPRYTLEAVKAAFLNLLPSGHAWNKEEGSNEDALAAAIAPTIQRTLVSAATMIENTFIPTTTTLLPEWEWSLGLPDPCQGTDPTFEARRAQARARFVDSGGQSIAHYIQFARDLGYTITVDEFMPGTDPRDGITRGAEAEFLWRVNASNANSIFFRAGTSVAGDRLLSFGDRVLECELNRIKPAHTQLIFAYT